MKPVTHVELRPRRLLRGCELHQHLGRDWNGCILEEAGHLELAHVRKERQLDGCRKVDQPNCVQRIDHDIRSIEISMGQAHQRAKVVASLHLGQFLQLRADVPIDQDLQVRRLAAKVLLVHAPHGLVWRVLAFLGDENVILALLAFERVPARDQRLVDVPVKARAALPQRRHNATRTKGLRQHAVHVPEGPHVVAPQERGAAQQHLLALIEQKVFECGQQAGRALRQFRDVPAGSRQFQPHCSKLLILLVPSVDRIAQDSGGAVRKGLEDVLGVGGLRADGLAFVQLHDAWLPRPAIGFKGLHPDHQRAAEASRQLLGLKDLKHLQ
mmetsp:Transcript_15748/g.37414  ORF Transcript_15748/g.37414 Transcript_15748/m.37414 type:complete len:326 (+) Transcript_15748:2492-3469(+)